MNYEQSGGKVILADYNRFDIGQTLECGQCFRYEKLRDNEYTVTAHGRLLHLAQYDGITELYPCTCKEFEDIWMHYFDLDRDYEAIKETLAANDYVMRDAVEHSGGIRILNQEPWECLVSFIISQNNRIPMIRKVVANICERYGEPNAGYYAFPSAAQLAGVTEDELMGCKTGFRAKYILDAVRRVYNGELDPEALKDEPMAAAREALMRIHGVGGKIADCVLLFSLGKREAFPTDVWIKRVMQHFYFAGKETPISEIHRLAKERYGEYAGYANSYLFAYARQFQIGK